jgi:hypothetical protein
MQAVIRRNRRGVEQGLLSEVLPWIRARPTGGIIMLVDVSNIFSKYAEMHPRSTRLVEEYIASRQEMGSLCDTRLRRFLEDTLAEFPHLRVEDIPRIRQALQAKQVTWVFVMQGSVPHRAITTTTFPRKPCLAVHVSCTNREGKNCYQTGSRKNPMDDYTLLFLHHQLHQEGIPSFVLTMDRFNDWKKMMS